MKSIKQLNFGFNDAENYKRRENKEFFNKIFVRNEYLDKLLSDNNYFLIGEKGTGKTAYAVFLTNNYYKENLSELKYIRETDYLKFIALKKNKHLELSDFTSIWKVILLLLISNSISEKEINTNPFSKMKKIKAVRDAINEYYATAFSPEIITALSIVENSKIAAELFNKYFKASGEESQSITFSESRFQINLLYIERKFKEALSSLKLFNDHFLFIDGIDIRPGDVKYSDYLECIKGLANAVWILNSDYFSQIKGSPGRFKIILLMRPDIFVSLSLQNSTNKLLDNSIYLDWRTTYPTYRHSKLFDVADTILRVQQNKDLQIGEAWDHYLPWKSHTKNNLGEYDDSFVDFLRISYSRPRDIITILILLKEIYNSKSSSQKSFLRQDLFSNEFLNKYSQYLMGSIRDQLSFYYSNDDYETFLAFFNFLNGKTEFDYNTYLDAYNKFTDYILEKREEIPEFVETDEKFLQFLYDTNVLCYIEKTTTDVWFRWCYRERSISNIAPKVKLNAIYRVHKGLYKELNLGSGEYEKNITTASTLTQARGR